jgi:dihydroorotase-like cyclic amidohydrolase
LFFTEDDLTWLGDRKGQVRPCLANDDDQKALWENISFIDIIASDHGGYVIFIHYLALAWYLFN